MVVCPGFYTYLSVILLEFTCQVSKSGPADKDAKTEWHRMLNSIAGIKFRKRTFIGVVSGRSCALALLVGA